MTTQVDVTNVNNNDVPNNMELYIRQLGYFKLKINCTLKST